MRYERFRDACGVWRGKRRNAIVQDRANAEWSPLVATREKRVSMDPTRRSSGRVRRTGGVRGGERDSSWQGPPGSELQAGRVPRCPSAVAARTRRGCAQRAGARCAAGRGAAAAGGAGPLEPQRGRAGSGWSRAGSRTREGSLRRAHLPAPPRGPHRLGTKARYPAQAAAPGASGGRVREARARLERGLSPSRFGGEP